MRQLQSNTSRQDREAPERATLEEVHSLVFSLLLKRLPQEASLEDLEIPSRRDLRRQLIRLRLGAFLRRSSVSEVVLSSAEAGFFLACSRNHINALIRSAKLQAWRVEIEEGNPLSPFAYRMHASEVRHFAASLGVEFEDSDDENE